MNYLEKNLLEEKEKLKNMIADAESFLQHAPEGSLRTIRNKNTEQYYWRTESSNVQGTYIKKSNMDLIRNLAQKDYTLKFLPVAKKQLKELDKLILTFQQDAALSTYSKLSLPKQKLVTPYVLTEKEYVLQWEQSHQPHAELNIANQKSLTQIASDTAEIITEKGELVRSKSEKILADRFYHLGIPYVYESSLYLHGYGYIKPDFLVLNKRTRKEYYFEHFGLMDQSDYCNHAIKKLETYAKNGFYQGKNLIISYETKMHPINMKHVESLIQEYLL